MGEAEARWPRLVALLCATLACQCSFKMTSLTTVEHVAPTAAECGKCHRPHYEEWQSSAHARAWTSPGFARATNGRRIGACLPCHAPGSVLDEERPIRTRAYLREEGVTCLSCHLHKGVQQGPFQDSACPHAVAGNPVFLSASMCGKCHRGAFESWSMVRRRDEDVETCQECHMPTTLRKATVASNAFAKVFVAFHETRPVKRHTFAAPDESDGPPSITLEARRGADGLELILANRLPHAVPAGDYGYRHARLTVEIVNTSGIVVTAKTRDFMPDLATAIPANGSVTWSLGVRASRDSQIRARLERLGTGERSLRTVAQWTIGAAP